MSEFENLGDNPAEPVPDVATAVEPGQPVEPEVVPTSSEPQEGTSSSGNNQDHEIEELLGRVPRVSVKFSGEDKAANENLESESSLEINKALHFYGPPHPTIPFLQSLYNEEPIFKKFFDKFTQTFFKFMKNLSDRHFVEIIQQEVDHEDKSLLFYCSSSKLLLTFQS